MADDIKVTLSIQNDVEISQKVRDLQTQLDNLGKTYTITLNGDVPKLTAATVQNYRDLADALRNLQGIKLNNKSLAAVTNLVQVQQSMSKMDTTAKNLSAQMDKLAQAYNSLGSGSKKTAKDPFADMDKYVDSVSGKIEKINSDLTKFSTSGYGVQDLQAKYKALTDALQEYSTAQDQATKTEKYKAVKAAMEDLNSSMNTFKQNKSAFESVSKAVSSLEKEIERLAKSGSDTSELQKQLEVLKQTRDNLYGSYKTGGTGSIIDPNAATQIQGTAQSVGELKSQVQGLKNNSTGAVRPLAEEAKEAESSMSSLSGVIQQIGGLLGKTMIGKIGSMAIGRAGMYMRQVAKEMVSSAVEIESSLAQLQVVTGASGSQLNQFFEASAASAKELGTTVTDMLGSVETFSRLGYNLQESLDLSKWATILGNIADMDVGSATTGITSIIKGWGKDVSEAEHIADVISVIGKNYAISSEEIVTAAEKSGAALMASGTSMEKSMALFAAANASVQNADVVGTALKTISARITKSTSDLEELGEDYSDLAEGMSKYREEIKAMSGVDIMIDDNTYKDVYDIFQELSHVWDQLDQTSQARISEILGGTRGLTVISSIMQNFGDAEAALADAMGATGTAMSANEKVMDTTEAKVRQLKTSFETLSHDVISSDLTKGIVNFGRTAVEWIDNVVNAFGALPVALGALTGLELIKNLGKLYCPPREQFLAA